MNVKLYIRYSRVDFPPVLYATFILNNTFESSINISFFFFMSFMSREGLLTV